VKNMIPDKILSVIASILNQRRITIVKVDGEQYRLNAERITPKDRKFFVLKK
jgi:hypothetical protein